ncbi:hypothetical protein C7212DRAFT_273090 [Tuber magnatum]|uniref:CCCH zinc finger and SMR domain-containing protein n=1 Tax=Tuber magnatum TaxID=42249 RepID=A0A317SZV9_9PEZI|nr:hypothetical protein C7212DRAFT_273090 [Tuber magnatum]
MISDELFEECRLILQDTNLLEEDQTEKVSALIASKTDLTGTPLDNETLDVLWRYREKISSTSSPPIRHAHTIVRRASPAPWQFPRVGTPTPSLGSTPPMAPPSFSPSFIGKSSPFPSPRPSPRLAHSSPLIPHSPNLNNYEPSFSSDPGFPPEAYGDFGSETVAWLVGDDNSMGLGNRSALQENMSPHDMLRSVLGEGRSDEEIEQALEVCGYDLSTTLTMLMDQQHGNNAASQHAEASAVIGKSTMPAPIPAARPVTPRNGVVCRFFLSTGQCLRADCRFSHDLGTTICKYWLIGSCLAGETCIFSHDPAVSVSKMTIDNNSRNSTPPPQLQFHDSTAFPALASDQWATVGPLFGTGVNPPPGFKLPISRPNSRQQSRERERSSTPVPAVDDTDAFPSLSSSAKASGNGKKRRNNKSDGGNNVPIGSSSLADVVRATPSPSPHSNRTSTSSGASSNRWSGIGGSPSSKRSSRVSAAHIPAPQQIPWMETGSSLNKVYLKHRKDALAHGMLRAKYLQQANSAWHRGDAKSAKEHSRKANNENMAMMKAHKEASKAIYEERNKGASSGTELFVDLHGLLPEEACKYLEDILVEHQTSTRPLYAIVGTGHHSKNNKDKIGKAVRAFLDEWKYAYRDFSASGDRNAQGGILGIDPSSFDKSLLTAEAGPGSGSGSLVTKKDPPKGPGGKKK